jgi:hypothetical protein
MKATLTSGHATPTNGSAKRILPAFLLCLFFGVFGVHAFYAGRTRRGRMVLVFPAMLLVMLCIAAAYAGDPPATALVGVVVLGTWGTGIAAAVMAVADFIAIISGQFRDGDGNVITEWT